MISGYVNQGIAARVRKEIGSDRFYGGAYYHNDGGLHPAKYHDGLLRAVRTAGAQAATYTQRDDRNKTAGAGLSIGWVGKLRVAACSWNDFRAQIFHRQRHAEKQNNHGDEQH